MLEKKRIINLIGEEIEVETFYGYLLSDQVNLFWIRKVDVKSADVIFRTVVKKYNLKKGSYCTFSKKEIKELGWNVSCLMERTQTNLVQRPILKYTPEEVFAIYKKYITE